MEPSVQIHTLAKLVDADNFASKKTRTLDLPQEIKKVTSEVDSEKFSA